jgi:hypothetical protein
MPTQGAILEKELDSTLKLVNEWLKFAEQKNAAFLVFNASLVWGISKIYEQDPLAGATKYLFLTGNALCVLSGLICVWSFMPILNMKIPYSWFYKEKSNSLFFQHISLHDEDSYLKLVNDKTSKNKQSFSGYENDYANQIIINSKIAVQKYMKFKCSSWLTLISIICFISTKLIEIFQS